MINLFKIKGQKKEEAANSNGGPPVKKQSPGELRLHKDIAELNLPKTTKISFPNGKDDLMNFEATLRPDEAGHSLSPSKYLLPTLTRLRRSNAKLVYHPNIDLEGNVCLNILREDWKPVLNINTIIYGLNLLFSQPNDEDPLNHEAAAVLRDNPQKFQRNVQMAMSGGYVDNTHFPRCK
ncbi:unnamed protein product [Triticum turgidum subsp. durum]|uniref:UBC core domain-containing protein n=1 Tax=Triticum turgidum subsp. durum TaxID=4567 RepID=A0A9R0YD60_TRITD|nr:unnamed protein product [Triticum turgidum subsp. durum]